MASSEFGFGHLSRVLRLESEFKSKGWSSIVVIDHMIPAIKNLYPETNFFELYPNGDFIDENNDLQNFITAVSFEKQPIVVLDDYRLGSHWETGVRKLADKLVVLDDNNNRKHNCDFIVDPKWQGTDTYCRYASLVNEDCKRLLGPEYLLIDPKYANTSLKQKAKNKDEFTVLVNIGGGSDWSAFKEFIEELIEKLKIKKNLTIKILIGPFSKGTDYVTDLAESSDFVVPVGPVDTILDELSKTDFFISAAGGTLFEAMALRIPTVSFTLAPNQNNDPEHLEQLGHFFSVGNILSIDQKKFAELCSVMIDQYDRVQSLTQKTNLVKIDGAGASRVVDIILGELVIDDIKSDSFDTEPLSIEMASRQFQKIGDEGINLYRRSRNIQSNLKNMTDTKPVSELDHYLWWFKKNQRSSFLSTKNNKPEIIFWHQIAIKDFKEYLIGGWFACQSETTGSAAVFALKEQLTYTDAQHPGLEWVAVIHKSNKFVFKLNQMFGFAEAQIGTEFYSAARTFFPQADPYNFHFLYRKK